MLTWFKGQQQYVLYHYRLVMHSTLAFTPQGLPLGLLDQQIWARPEPERAAKRTKQRPIADKESHKWLSALRESVSMTPS
jgi:hypothetical protein